MIKYFTTLLIIFLFLAAPHILYSQNKNYNPQSKYANVADLIIKEAMKDSSSWERLAYFCDMFGPRLSGSKNLENAIEWVEQELRRDGFVNVRKDEVLVPHWVRGNEYCQLIYPREADIPMLALGGSIGTPKEGIEADAIVLLSFEELELRKKDISGKIVVFNQPFISYGQSVQYRFYGAIRAASYGAVASLIRSVSPAMTRNVHTGMMGYADTVLKIPHAAISPEDAELLYRIQSRGITPKIRLYMEAETLQDAISHNVMGEVRGKEFPDEILAIGGHSDSWDTGTGAHDDASGCIATWEAIKLLKKLNLIPKRTLRLVLWTNEENGIRGGNAYRDKYKDEKHVLMFEMDGGAFRPSAIRLTAPKQVFDEFAKIEPLLKKVDDVQVLPLGGGVDIRPMMDLGIPGMSLSTDDGGKYFWYHHSHSDTVDKIDPMIFNKCIAAIAIAIYVYADMPSEILNNN